MIPEDLTIQQALNVIEPLAGKRYCSIDFALNSHERAGTRKREIEFTVYVDGLGVGRCSESATTLAEAVRLMEAKLRSKSDTPVEDAQASLAGLETVLV